LKVQAAKETYKGRNVYRSKTCKAPFTFFTNIFIPEHFKEQEGTELVLQHEWAHASQLHTLDILLAELYGIVFWFNPFVILHKRSLKTVHEYLADSAVARSKNDKITYMQLLVQTVSYKPYNGLSSNFYWLTLKKRMNMITKNKTSKFRLFTYLLIFPVLAIIIQSFSMSQINAADTANAEAAYGNVPCMMPIKEKDLDKITSGFGMRMHPIKKVEMMHNGVDMVAKIGTPVMATADGRVVKVEFNGEGKGYGRAIIIQHDNTFSTLYAQLSEFKVNAGEKVKQGQVIGLVGSSGMSTGPHLHYEVRKNGEPVDPGNYFSKK
jgi:murein DD-endopeptidase MepM/ murein hydrolase activator NlpD